MCKSQTVYQDGHDLKPAALLMKKHSSKLLNFVTVHLHLVIYAGWVLASGVVAFTVPVGIFRGQAWQDQRDSYLAFRFSVLQLEILGLMLVREKIKSRANVSGISGMAFVMQGVMYFTELAFELVYGYDFVTIFSLVWMVFFLDIARSIFVTHYDTYDAELDVLKAWYMVPALCALALLLRPNEPDKTNMQNLVMGFVMYVQAFGLLPQVVMMARSGGTVEAPIANSVAATAIGRCLDICYSLLNHPVFYEVSNLAAIRLWLNGQLSDIDSTRVFSFVLISATQVVQVLLVVDFLYYFFKARARSVPFEI